MINNFNQLKNKFSVIYNSGWIKSLRGGPTGIGYTLESLLGCEENSLEYPDFMGIEIKAKRRYSVGNITLFSANPDGDYLFSIEHILKKHGYPDKDYPQFNVFNISISNADKNRYKLKIDYLNEKIYLLVYRHGVLYDNIVSWSFDMLKDKLEKKLSYLAIIRADVKKINNYEYFKYYDIKFYKLRSFETFINLINTGIIRISFRLGIKKSGENIGRTENHGTSFDINIKNIDLLFEEIII